jgi:hypothetical protein
MLQLLGSLSWSFQARQKCRPQTGLTWQDTELKSCLLVGCDSVILFTNIESNLFPFCADVSVSRHSFIVLAAFQDVI